MTARSIAMGLLVCVPIVAGCVERALPLDETFVAASVDAAAPDPPRQPVPPCAPNCARDCQRRDERSCTAAGCVADYCQEREGEPTFMGCREPDATPHACPSVGAL
jgi:hypothetical protein